MLKIIQYRNQCIGCGICQEMQPEFWRMSRKDGKATLIGAEVKKNISMISIYPGAEDKTREVVAACPARVIKVS